MAEEKFVLMNLEDAKSKELAQVISSDTARKILSLLADKPLSETEISEKLSMPLPTVHYNIQQLLKANIIEIKDFLWSEKGKKIQLYKLSNKLIIIAPKTSSISFIEKLKDIIPVVLGGFLVSVGIYAYQIFRRNISTLNGHEYSSMLSSAESKAMGESTATLQKIPEMTNSSTFALWFLLGIIFAALLYTLTVYLRRKK
ncbi:MAG TPA: winged helix-turn-helix domain-containing protein [Candidatus Nanoarchaeia archaeon]|nr:winged helix-turn-helix domain-containing protein [Candidatus Nanoarchaeia archaeon]